VIPIWLVPIFALICAVNRVIQFAQAPAIHPAKYLWLAKAMVDLYFMGIYIWIATSPQVVSLERANAVRAGILVLFFVNVLAVLIERNILYHLVEIIKGYLHRLILLLLFRGSL
jgi:hypothetical protein